MVEGGYPHVLGPFRHGRGNVSISRSHELTEVAHRVEHGLLKELAGFLRQKERKRVKGGKGICESRVTKVE